MSLGVTLGGGGSERVGVRNRPRGMAMSGDEQGALRGDGWTRDEKREWQAETNADGRRAKNHSTSTLHPPSLLLVSFFFLSLSGFTCVAAARYDTNTYLVQR